VEAGNDVLVGQTQGTLNSIDHAQVRLKYLAGLKPGDKTAPKYRDETVDYIGAHLLDKGSLLNRALVPDVPGATGLLKAASDVEVARRFFDVQSSKAVKSVAGYYALYEAELAVLIAEYQHAKPDTYSDDATTTVLSDATNRINAQAAYLKPDVPSGAVVDTKTNKMWTQHFTPNPVDASAFFKLINEGFRNCRKVYSEEAFGPRQIKGLPFGDWVLPGKDDFATLISGRGALGGVTYLQQAARMSPHQNFNRGWSRRGVHGPARWLGPGEERGAFRESSDPPLLSRGRKRRGGRDVPSARFVRVRRGHAQGARTGQRRRRLCPRPRPQRELFLEVTPEAPDRAPPRNRALRRVPADGRLHAAGQGRSGSGSELEWETTARRAPEPGSERARP
jgi:hypothetical protein